MKKILLLLLSLSSILLCSSCQLLFILLEGISDYEQVEYNTESYKTDKNKAHFYVQLNTSKNQIIPANCTAYCEYGTRNVEDLQNDIESDKNVNFENLFIPVLQNTSFELEERLRNEFNESFDFSTRNAAPVSCSTRAITTGSTDYFYLLDSKDERTLNNVKCYQGYSGTKCTVWYYDNCSFVTESYPTICKNIGIKFDSICEKEERIVGSHKYTQKYYSNFIDPQDKIDIVVFDIFGDASKEQTGGTFGYFNNNDFSTTAYYSNQRQVIFVDSYFYTQSPNMVYSTLAHEFNHLLNFCNKTVQYGVRCETWYTEMLSMIVEDAFQDYLGISDLESPKGRLTSCAMEIKNNTPVLYPYNNSSTGFVFNYNKGITNWDSNNPLPNYSNTYAFGAYLVRNFGGFDLLKQIATNEYVNEASINDALIRTGYSDWDFTKLISQEYNILINNSTSTSSDNISLNKSKTFSGDSTLIFKAIDIYKMKYYSRNDRNEIIEKGPIPIKEDVINFVLHGCDKNSRRPIYPNGFDLAYIPEGYTSLDLEVPVISEYDIKLYEY